MTENFDISALDTMALDDLVALPAEMLFDLQGAIEHELDLARLHHKVLAEVLRQRYHLREVDMRRAAAKPTGRIRFDDEGLVVVAEAPKQVHWDKDKLAAALETFPVHIAEQYAKWTLTVDERRYAEAPPTLKAALEPARTVSVGKATYRLDHKEEEAA